MHIIRFGLGYYKRYLPIFLLAALLSSAAIVCDLAIPLIDAGFIDFVLAYDAEDPPSGGLFSFLYSGKYGAPGTWQLFGTLAVLFTVIFLLRILCIYVKNYILRWSGLQMENKLREVTYDKLLALDGETLSRYNMGELLTVINRDTIIFKDFYSLIAMGLFDSVLMIALSVVALTTMDWRLLFIPVAIAPFFVFSLVRYLSASRKLFRAIRDGYSEINLDVQENIDAVRIVRSFAAEEKEMSKFDACNGKVRDLSIRQVKLNAKYNAIFTGFQQIGYVGTIVIAVLLVLSGNLYIGSLAAATTYVTKIIAHITQISNNCFSMQNQLVSGGRLQKLLSEESAVPEYPSALVFSPAPHVRLDDVSVTLGGKQALKHISLDVPYGKKVGVMGGTGSGKSVLLKCLSRIFDTTDGAVLIDGQDVKAYPLEVVRAEFAYVFQDVFLFSNTIDANIAFARPDCDEEIVKDAAETAQAAKFIEKLDEGYSTIVGERGMGLSGGQKQRISIARALVKGAPVLVFDDASSALDMATEKRVLAAVKEKCAGRTFFIASHRVSSVMDCDEILFLRDGEIAERGTAEELIAKGGAFAAIWKLQTSDGQLDDSSYGKEEL